MNTFDVTNGKLHIGDPVYKKDSAEAKFFLPRAKNGRWVCIVEVDEKVFGNTINKLIVSYSEEESKAAGLVDTSDDFHRAMSMICGKAPGELKSESASISAESGMAGIFDYKSYRNDKIVNNVTRLSDKIVCDDEPWYSICCDRVLSENHWGCIPNGCVSAAKDGVINVTAHFNMFGEAERVEIDFEKANTKIEDGEDSEDDEIYEVI
jgi:hypothetical protein